MSLDSLLQHLRYRANAAVNSARDAVSSILESSASPEVVAARRAEESATGFVNGCKQVLHSAEERTKYAVSYLFGMYGCPPDHTEIQFKNVFEHFIPPVEIMCCVVGVLGTLNGGFSAGVKAMGGFVASVGLYMVYVGFKCRSFGNSGQIESKVADVFQELKLCAIATRDYLLEGNLSDERNKRAAKGGAVLIAIPCLSYYFSGFKTTVGVIGVGLIVLVISKKGDLESKIADSERGVAQLKAANTQLQAKGNNLRTTLRR